MSEKFDELVKVMSRLRAPGGCPWDREQTYATLAQYLLEECYETFDAIHEAERTGDTHDLKEELGDVLLQVVIFIRRLRRKKAILRLTRSSKA